jgi:fatty-acyl-CoA synthase
VSPYPTFPEHLRNLALTHSDRPALLDEQGTVTFGELGLQVDRTASALIATGLTPGARVGLALVPSACYVTVVLAAMTAGFVPVPMNTRLTAFESRRFLEPIDPEVILADQTHHGFAQALERPIILLTSTDSTEPLNQRMTPLAGAEWPDLPAVAPEDPALILPTGGTSGTPKGVWFDHATLWRIVAGSALNLPRSPSDLDLYFAPFFHIMLPAQLLPPMFMGGPSEIMAEFDPGRALESVARGASRLGGAPTLMVRLREHEGFDSTPRGHVTQVLFGAAPSTPEFIHQLLEDYPSARVTSLYGATEFGGTVCTIPHEELAAGNVEGVGYPRPGQYVRIVDDEGRPCEPGEIGYFSVRAMGQANGYWGRPEETADAFRPEGIRVGDMGWSDESGRFFIIGRDSEMIITGGENVFPSEVEPVLADHPAVRDVIVYGVPDDNWGHRVEALVVLAADKSLTTEELRSFSRDRLASYKRPKRVHVVATIPVTANNKPDRNAARQIAARRTGQ